MRSKPHVSSAIRQLRGWVTLCALVLGLCAGVQALVFAFVHYTDVRWTELKPATPERPLRVIGATGDSRTTTTPPANADRSAPAEPNRALSETDGTLRMMSRVATGFGGVASVVLVSLCLMGVAVGAGASVPGVERAVTAGVWAMVLACLALPLRSIFPELAVPGVFSAYATMTQQSALVLETGEGGLSLLASHVFLPLIVMGLCVVVAVWFRTGVEQGVIVTSVSELDEAVERELAAIRKRGVAAGTTRAVGALNRAMGDSPSGVAMTPEPAVDAPETGGALRRRLNEIGSAGHDENGVRRPI